MTTDPFAAYLPYTIGAHGTMLPGAAAHDVPADDLFGSIEAFVGSLLDGRATPTELHRPAATLAAFVVSPNLAVTVDLLSVRPSHVQCLLAALRREPPLDQRGLLVGHTIDPAAGLALWTRAGPAVADVAVRAWRAIVTAGEVEPLVALTTPWLYGNKLRLTRFIAPVAVTSLPTGAPVLDLMAGTGIVARALSDRHPVSVNDPNPYASLLSRCHWIDAGNIKPADLLAALRPAYAENPERLARLIGSRLEEESAFLHGNPDYDAMLRYTTFTQADILQVTDGKESDVARLTTERYSNVYFGIAQAVEIDSLRSAIEHVFSTPSTERELCLCALLLACTSCATGPHFAQPVLPRSLKAFQTIVERRARSVAWEFDLALARLAARRLPTFPMGDATGLDWRGALEVFANRASGGPAGVYIDPPYSKLQYSRYYHVLNVLLSYDYPPIAGAGRYPPRNHRFSSRLEYQPGIAQREITDLLRAAADKGLTTILSYGEGGFASMDSLARAMAGLYVRVELFSEELRHHSQGRPLGASRATVLEYLLVGHPT